MSGNDFINKNCFNLENECNEIEKSHSIYIQKTGRITLTHVNKSNVKYLVESMKKAIEKKY